MGRTPSALGNLLRSLGTVILGLLMIALIAAVIIGLPLLLIWSLNTLGVANAAYGLYEWLAAFLLTTLFLGGSGSEK